MSRTVYVLNRLARHEVSFVALLLALRAIVRPYAGLAHDAKLYSLQVMNHVSGGFFADDLFFKFGSQDSFSVFSYFVAPVVNLLGLTWGFLFVHMGVMAALIYAELRLAKRLIPNKSLAALAAIMLAVMDVPYGGRGVFSVHECFVTARLPAVACSLWSLSLLLDRRYGWGMLLAVLAVAFHPLMGIGGLAVTVAFLITTRVSLRWFVIASLAVAPLGVAMLLSDQLGGRLLQTMDPEWFDIVQRISPHCLLTQWWWGDWFRIGCTIALALLGRRFLDDDAGRLLGLTVYLAVGSLVVTGLAEHTRYALLMQGQAYRGLWLLQLLNLPVAVLLIARLRRSDTVWGKIGGLLAFAYIGNILVARGMDLSDLPLVVAITSLHLALWCLILWFVRHMSKDTEPRMEWIWPALLLGLVTASFQLSADATMAVFRFLAAIGQGPLESWWLAGSLWATTVGVAVGVLFVVLLWKLANNSHRRLGTLAVLCWLAVNGVVVWVTNHDAYRHRYRANERDAQQVSAVLARHTDSARPPLQVYWTTNPELIWYQLKANCYTDWSQVQGAVFSRGTSVEGQRRALLVRPFEVADMRQQSTSPRYWERKLNFYQAQLDMPAPQREDLFKLAQDVNLDWIIVRQPFDGLHSARAGQFYLYDCQQLRGLRNVASDGNPLAVGTMVSKPAGQTNPRRK